MLFVALGADTHAHTDFANKGNFKKPGAQRPACACFKNNGIQDDLPNWIEQWLTKRNQRVILENHITNKLHVKSVVPQGAVLGPLMFLLYINDIVRNMHNPSLAWPDHYFGAGRYRLQYKHPCRKGSGTVHRVEWYWHLRSVNTFKKPSTLI